MARTQRMAQIEALLADEPDDAFLRYGLAMEHASAGDAEQAVRLLLELIALKRGTPEPYVPAYLQAGQFLAKINREPEACTILREGIVRAAEVGDEHARSEMLGLLGTLE